MHLGGFNGLSEAFSGALVWLKRVLQVQLLI